VTARHGRVAEMITGVSLLIIFSIFFIMIILLAYRIIKEMSRLQSQTSPAAVAAARAQFVATVEVPKVLTPPPAYETINDLRRTLTPPPTYAQRPPTGHVLTVTSRVNNQPLVMHDVQ